MEQIFSYFDQVILQFFEQMRNPVLDTVFSCFSFLGEGTVLTVAVILVYWLASRKTGEQLALTTLSSLSLNVFLKTAVARTRPYASNVVTKVEVDTFFVSTADLNPNASFPSGHSQSAASFLGGVACRAKRVWVWLLCILFTLAIMISRLYLGVHYPTDVLTGFALGLAVAIFWDIVYRVAYGARYYILALFAVLALVPVALAYPHDYVKTAGLIAGAAVFLPYANMIAKPARGARRWWRILLGAIATAATFAVSLLFPEGEGFALLKYFLIVGGATLGAQALFRLFKV